jgi:DNA-binding NarL/FixJ family response regulator
LSEGEFHAPASNEQIAKEVFLTIDAVKMQLRTMFNRFGLDQLPQNQKRAGLAEVALRDGLVTRRDL